MFYHILSRRTKSCSHTFVIRVKSKDNTTHFNNLTVEGN